MVIYFQNDNSFASVDVQDAKKRKIIQFQDDESLCLVCFGKVWYTGEIQGEFTTAKECDTQIKILIQKSFTTTGKKCFCLKRSCCDKNIKN